MSDGNRMTRLMAIILKCTETSNHYVVTQNEQSNGGQLYFKNKQTNKQTHRKQGQKGRERKPVKRYKLPVKRQRSTRDVTYNMTP